MQNFIHTKILRIRYTHTPEVKLDLLTVHCTFVIPSNIAVTKIKFVNALLENIYHCQTLWHI